MSTEQASGVFVSVPFAVSVMRELLGLRRLLFFQRFLKRSDVHSVSQVSLRVLRHGACAMLTACRIFLDKRLARLRYAAGTVYGRKQYPDIPRNR